jgi:hypothetical protein
MRLANINGRQISSKQVRKGVRLRLGALFAQVWVWVVVVVVMWFAVVSCRVGPNERRFKKSTCEKYLGRETEIY